MFFSIVFLAFVLATVSVETRALVSAYTFTRAYPKKQYRRQLFVLRYFFNSVIFHEIFAFKRRVKPAYKLSSFMVLHAMVFVLMVLRTGAHTEAELIELAGMGCVVGGVYFVVTYGRAFIAHRALVARLMERGNPLAFAEY